MSPAPNKAVMNLTTAAHKVVFNPTAQILAISSKFKDSALKLVRYYFLARLIKRALTVLRQQ
jgi:hypothetical protein